MTVDEVIQAIVEMLDDNDASEWSVQDKGALAATVKLALQREQDQEN